MSRKFHWLVISAVVIIALLISIRAALPYAIKSYVNDTLDQLEDYDGRISDVDLHIIRGAYEIEGIEILKSDGGTNIPFFKADELDLSVEWRQLLNRALVAEIVFLKPQINFVAGAPSKKQEQTGQEEPWTEVVRELFPLKINKFAIENGSIHYRDPYGKPDIDVYANDLWLTATNLTNSEKLSETLMANVEAHARAMGKSPIKLQLDLNPYEKEPTFNLNFSLEKLDMTLLNDFFRQYADIDVQKGTLALYSEVAASKGEFDGYAKPFLRNLDVLDIKKEDLSMTQKVKEGLAEWVGSVFKNRDQDTVATKVQLSGRLDQPDIGIFSAIGSVLRHTFIQALQPNLSDKLGTENLKDN